jgi:hypothetical protein
MIRREIRVALDARLLANVRRLGLALALERGVARVSLAALVEEALSGWIANHEQQGRTS